MEAVAREILKQKTDQSQEELSDNLAAILHTAAKAVLEGKEYEENSVGQWINDITQTTLDQLCQKNLPFKYIVQCSIKQAGFGSIHCSTAAKWHADTDLQRTVLWESDHLQFVGILVGLEI